MSGEKVPYHLRQNKYVDRQLFVEVLSYINRVRPIRDYLYVGFGGAYLEDFKILHNAFGNESMLSLEKEPWVFSRQEFNVPYGCVRVTNTTSSDFVESFEEKIRDFDNAPVIVWLDYPSPAELRDQIVEFEALAAKLRKFDVVRITLNSNLNALAEKKNYQKPQETVEELQGRRFDKLRARLGDYAPGDASAADMTEERYPGILLRALQIAAIRGLESSDSVLEPLLSIVYNDAEHSMLTLTGIVLQDGSEADFLRDSGLDKFEFRADSWEEPLRINVPYLSVREKFHLDQMIFRDTTKSSRSRLKPGTTVALHLGPTADETKARVQEYLKFYRYYPHYHRVQY